MRPHRIYRFFLVVFFLLMLSCPKIVISGASEGLLLWYRRVLPVLFPFLLITGLMTRTGSIGFLNRLLSPVLAPFFRISDSSVFSVICGFFCGFPVGAKSCADLADRKIISSEEGEYLLSFCNNISPAFVTGYLASQSLDRPDLAFPCLFLLSLSAVTCSFIFRRWYLSHPPKQNPAGIPVCTKTFLPFAEALDESILSACDSVTKIGGYMMAFSVLLTFLKQLPFHGPLWSLILLPGIELTSAVCQLCQADLPFEIRFLLVMAHSSFGGLCAIFQTKCMIRSQKWSIFRYTAEKLITAVVTSLYAFCYLKLLQ